MQRSGVGVLQTAQPKSKCARARTAQWHAPSPATCCRRSWRPPGPFSAAGATCQAHEGLTFVVVQASSMGPSYSRCKCMLGWCQAATHLRHGPPKKIRWCMRTIISLQSSSRNACCLENMTTTPPVRPARVNAGFLPTGICSACQHEAPCGLTSWCAQCMLCTRHVWL